MVVWLLRRCLEARGGVVTELIPRQTSLGTHRLKDVSKNPPESQTLFDPQGCAPASPRRTSVGVPGGERLCIDHRLPFRPQKRQRELGCFGHTGRQGQQVHYLLGGQDSKRLAGLGRPEREGDAVQMGNGEVLPGGRLNPEEQIRIVGQAGGECPGKGREQDARPRMRPHQVGRAVQGHHRFARAGAAGDARGPVVGPLDRRPLGRMQKHQPLLPGPGVAKAGILAKCFYKRNSNGL